MKSREEWNSILSGCAICCWIFAQEMPQFAHSPGGLFCIFLGMRIESHAQIQTHFLFAFTQIVYSYIPYATAACPQDVSSRLLRARDVDLPLGKSPVLMHKSM